MILTIDIGNSRIKWAAWSTERIIARGVSGYSAENAADVIDRLFSAVEKPQRVFLVHGDPEASAALEPKVQALGLETYRPGWREEVVLG